MLCEKLNQRLFRDRPVTCITLRIPVDVVDSLKATALAQGLRRLPDPAQGPFQRGPATR